MNVFVTSLLKIINNPDIQDTNYNIAYYLLLHYYDVFEMTGSLNHLLSIAIVTIVAYVVADLLKSKPIYESLLENLLKKRSLPTPQGVGEKVLLDFMILHNSPLDNHLVKEIQWPNHCLIVSLRRDGQEFIPHGDTYLKASDSIIVMCDKIDESYIYDTLSALTTEQI